MNPDDLARILDELGQRLGPTGEHVFALAVQFKVTSAVIWLVASVVVLGAIATATAIGLRFTARQYREVKANGTYFDSMDYGFPWLMGGIIAILPFLVASYTLIDSTITLANPEYAALRDIIRQIVR